MLENCSFYISSNKSDKTVGNNFHFSCQMYLAWFIANHVLSMLTDPPKEPSAEEVSALPPSHAEANNTDAQQDRCFFQPAFVLFAP